MCRNCAGNRSSSLSSSSDSDSKRDLPLPPVHFALQDEIPYKHLTSGYVIDAATGRKVNGDTTLVCLYDVYSETIDTVDKTLLRNLTTVAAPKIPCQIRGQDGELHPEGFDGTCRLFQTYNKLLIAPTVRLECELRKSSSTSPYLTLTVEFHFNGIVDNASGITKYSHSQDGVLSFTSSAATCTGFNLLSKHAGLLSESDKQVVELLRMFLKPSEDRGIEIKLHPSPVYQQSFSSIQSRLPGGDKPLLPTIGRPEYSAFSCHLGHIVSKHRGMCSPRDLMAHAAPFPHTLLDCPDTFATVKEAAAQLAYSAVAMEAEARTSLRLWDSVSHRGRLYRQYDCVVIGVSFNPFPKLGNQTNKVSFKLPRDLDTGLQFPNITIKLQNMRAVLMPAASGMGKHDAHFMITTHSLHDVTKDPKGPQLELERDYRVAFYPHHSAFTFTSQLVTVAQLQKLCNKRWHDILLNQMHNDIKSYDLTGCQDPKGVTELKNYAWLESWRHWNKEQLRVIHGLKAAKGGMTLVMGPAGTGKTLLQQAMAIYFWKRGFHVLALAPANSNATHLAHQMNKVQKEFPDLEFVRLYPGSRDIPVERLREGLAAERQVGHIGGAVLPFSELKFALEELHRDDKINNDFGVVARIIMKAQGPNPPILPISWTDTAEIRRRSDAWQVVRTFISVHKKYKLDLDEWKKMDKKWNVQLQRWEPKVKPQYPAMGEELRKAYDACKSQIIGQNRFMITTTGNVRAKELLSDWAPEGKVKGVVVFVDEAAKDLEVNVWAGIVCEKWNQKVCGVFMFGDDKQLSPTNTSSRKGVVFNPFLTRLDVALPNRLVREGFPCFRLKEQHRMNEHIAKFVSQEVYDNDLRNGPEATKKLDSLKPGLTVVLNAILTGEEPSSDQGSRSPSTETEGASADKVNIDSPSHEDIHTSCANDAVSEAVVTVGPNRVSDEPAGTLKRGLTTLLGLLGLNGGSNTDKDHPHCLADTTDGANDSVAGIVDNTATTNVANNSNGSADAANRKDSESIEDRVSMSGKCRLQWIEVQGTRQARGPSNSMLVPEHVDVFFSRILPPLQKYFAARKESVEGHLMVICAYGAAVHEYEHHIAILMKQNSKRLRSEFPRVLTVDASQGQESFMVVLDASAQHGDVVGFMADRGRVNVAITRAREVFWIIGGSMNNRFRSSAGQRPNLLTQYKKDLEQRGRVQAMS